MNIQHYFPILLIFLFISCHSQPPRETPLQVECQVIEGLKGGKKLNICKIKVPENHDQPEGKQIELSYTVLKSKDKNANEYPMMYFTGGPGGSALITGRISRWLDHPIREKRDIILLDQRGIGYSSAIPNMYQELQDIIGQDANSLEEEIMVSKLMAEYKQKCKAEGIELKYYNTFQNARDIGILMKHLGYEKYNLYGGSYGTRLARVVQDMFPERLNAVILNSPAPLSGDMLLDRLKSYTLALERVFDFCENDKDCSAQYPNLREDYFIAINQLEENPLELTIDQKPYYINAQDGIYYLRRKLYNNDARTAIPALIQAYKHRETQLVASLASVEFRPTYNFAMWLAVERYEQFDAENTDAMIDSTYQSMPLFPAQLGFFTAMYKASRNWHKANLSKEKRTFSPSDIPTIIMVNQYDPVTPPEYGHIFMQTLSKGQLFILDEGGHGGGNTACRNQVMIDFMDDPHAELDISCLNLYEE